MHTLSPLLSLSPLDGRYRKQNNEIRWFGSEFGLIHYRLRVEILWFETLMKHDGITSEKLTDKTLSFLKDVHESFTVEHAQAIKEIELTTNHDVKAVEYYLAQMFDTQKELKPLKNFIHFACTSEDINNLAYALMLKDLKAQTLGTLNKITNRLSSLVQQTANQPLLSLTHGQPASPTTLGKELRNVTARLERQIQQLERQAILGKINGAVGNFNAHTIAYPEVDWLTVSQQFVETLGLTWNPLTTQIEPHDGMAELFDNLARINTILIDFSQDVWGYISRGVFTQKSKDSEVGSSTMPHKVNPIDFENAEGNLGVANALFEFMARKLPRSRYQRDLTDSTVQRNIGSAFGYMQVALSSLQKGLNKLKPNVDLMMQQLDDSWETIGEAIQTVMRRYGIDNPYEQLKELTRGKAITQDALIEFINGLDIPEQAKASLKTLRPETYLGLAATLAEKNFDLKHKVG